MSKAPFWPVATDAMIADTRHLSTLEFGAYVKLMMAQWRNNGKPLANDPKRLARMMDISSAQFKKIWPVLSEFFDVDETTISQQRLIKDFKKIEEKIEKNKRNGKRGGDAKSLKTKEVDLANATNSLRPNTYQPEPEPERKKNTKKKVGDLELETMFLEWGEIYPKDVRGLKAKTEFEKALERIPFETLKDKTEQYADLCESENRKPQHIREAKNWLADSGWTELAEQENPWQERVNAWKATGQWMEHLWGAPPDQPNTKTPKELI